MTGSGTFLGHTEAVAMSVVGGRAEVTMPHLQRQTILYRSRFTLSAWIQRSVPRGVRITGSPSSS